MKKAILVVLWIFTIGLIGVIFKMYFFTPHPIVQNNNAPIFKGIVIDRKKAVVQNNNAPIFKGIVIDKQKAVYLDKRKLLAKVIWCEDRRSEKAMRMVFSVIYHRAKEKTLEGLYKVAVKPKQFSCLNNPDILLNQRRNKLDIEMEKVALKIVDEFLSGKFKPVVKATHYYQKKIVKRPNWAKGKKVVAQYKGHVFLN